MSLEASRARLSALDADLRSISLESRRTHPDVKLEAERAILKIRPLSEETNTEIIEQGLRSKSVVRPFLVACSTKQSPLVLLSLASLQRMVSAHLLASESIAMLIGSLRILVDSATSTPAATVTVSIQAEGTQEDVQLKILQTLSLLTSPRTFDTGEDSIAQALAICFRLYCSTSPVIHHTAAATLSQVVDLIFDRATEHVDNAPENVDDSGKKHEHELSPKLDTAYRLLVDLVHLASGDPPQWLTTHGELPRYIVVEMLNSLLRDHATFICSQIVFVDVLRSQLRPLLLRLLSSVGEFMLVLRLLRCVCLLILYYHSVLLSECEMFLSLIIRMLEPEFQLWNRVLALETIKSLTMEPTILLLLYSNFDNGVRSTKVFSSIAYALGRVVSQVGLEEDAVTSSGLLWGFHIQKSRGLELLGESHAPEFDELYAVAVAMESLVNIANALSVLCKEEEHREMVTAMLNNSLSPLLASFTLLLEHSYQDEENQFLLLAFQTLAFTSGSLHLVEATSSIIKTLCDFALPIAFRPSATATSRGLNQASASDLPCDLSTLNLQAMKALFNIAHKLGHHIGESWLTLLKTFEQLDTILSSQQGHSVSIAADASRRQAASDEIAVLSAALAHLFSASVHLDLDSLMHLLQSLGTLSLSALANAATAEGPQEREQSMFALTNLVQTVEYNMFRIGELWQFCLDHLNCVIRHRSASARSFGVLCLNRLIKQALKQLALPPPSDQPNYSPGHSQNQFLQPLRQLLVVKYPDTGSGILAALYDVLQSSGQSLSEGWSSVLSIVSDVLSVPDLSQDYIPVAFKVVQLIVDDFLDCIPHDRFEQLFSSIGLYGRQRSATNISFTSIGLLWQVSDHITRVHLTTPSPSAAGTDSQAPLTSQLADNLQLAIFDELKQLCMDSRAEVRNSAVQTLHSTIAACGGQLSADSWQKCHSNSLFPLLKFLFAPLDARHHQHSQAEADSQLGTSSADGRPILMLQHHSRDSAAKQWDETRVHALQGSSRVFRHYFTFHMSKQGQMHWKEYVNILERCMTVESSEVAHSAIESIQQVLMAPNTVPVLIKHRNLMEDAIQLYTNVVVFAIEHNSSSQSRFDVYTSLLESVCCLLDGGADVSPPFDAEDVLTFLRLSAELSRLRCGSPVRQAALQRATLKLIDLLTNVHATPDLYASVLHHLVTYVNCTQQHDRSVDGDGVENELSDVSVAFAVRSVPVLLTLYCSKCPPSVRGRPGVLESIVRALYAVVVSPLLPANSPLITSAVRAFIEIVRVGVVSLNIVCESAVEASGCWQALREACGGFLLLQTPTRLDAPTDRDRLNEVESLQVSVVQLIYQDVLPNSQLASLDIQKEIIGLLNLQHESQAVIGPKAAAAFEATDKTRLLQACIAGLFSLSTVSGSTATVSQEHQLLIASLSTPLLLRRCRSVLLAYIGDERRSGERPLPRGRREEVAFILRQLSVLNVHESIVPSTNTLGQAIGRSGGKGHLFQLYSSLCECISIREPELRALVASIFTELGRELRLVP